MSVKGGFDVLTITGYSDQIYCRPGETVSFMVSCFDHAEYEAEIVQIICGDANPQGPGVKEIVVPSPISGLHPGRFQDIKTGSYIEVPAHKLLNDIDSFTVSATIWPTTPAKGLQAILSKWSANGAGFALVVTESGALGLLLGDADGNRETVALTASLLPRHWFHVSASFDAATGRVRLSQSALQELVGLEMSQSLEASVTICPGRTEAPVRVAALTETNGRMAGLFNGKIEAPKLFGGDAGKPIAAWDFSIGMGSAVATDISGHGLDGEVVNIPARAMTGSSWDGSEFDWKQNPSQWAAIHFHDDDLYDAGWQVDFAWTVPDDLPSGLYAARLRAGDAEEYIPFAVGPRRGAESRIAFLLPTASYHAYANDHLGTDGGNGELLNNVLTVLSPHDLFLNEHWEYGGSLYDAHSDASGIGFSSRLRPIVNMRPKRDGILGGFGHSRLWQFAADTHIIDWLDALGHGFDVITDEELDAVGYDLLKPYQVVITGSHPEYVSADMSGAILRFRDTGGRLMYMGGDGFYWRVAFDKSRPGVIELRRTESGVRAWAAAPGEYYHAFDGKIGGLWSRAGRSPHALVGVGFAAQGFDLSSWYERQPDSFKPKVAFIFDGIGADDKIGDFGLIGGGAAGLEVDRAAPEFGTPANAYVLASSVQLTDTYLLVPEEFLETIPTLGAHENPNARADLVFFEVTGGGAVFSTGSIAWAGSLAHHAYRNSVSRITDNVLKRFLDPAPF